MADVTLLLDAAEAGDRKTAADLLPLVYDELRKEAPPKPVRRSLLDRLGDVVCMAEGLPADASQNIDHYL